MRSSFLFRFVLPSLPILAEALCLAQGPAPLTSVQQVVALTNAQAAHSLPVKLEATVTYVRPLGDNLFVMDGGYGVYVRFGDDIGLIPGDRIAISGITAPSFRPVVTASHVRFLAHGSMPPAHPATFEDLIQSKWNSQYVQVTGRVLSAALDNSLPAFEGMRIRVKVPHGIVEGIVNHKGDLLPEDLLEADVRMTGIAGGEYDSKMQLAGMWLDVNSSKDVVILHRPVADPWSRPVTPMDEVISAYRYGSQSERVRIAGTLTYFDPGSLAVLEHDGKSMLVKTSSSLPLQIGKGVEATGFPGIADENVRLEDAQLRPAAEALPTKPQTIQWESASAGEHAYDLVAMEGQVVGLVHDSRVNLFIILSHGHLFSATLRHSSSESSLPAAVTVTPSVGSQVRVTGVCFVDAGNHWQDRLWFDLRMRSLDDLVVVQQPSWWTVKRLSFVVMLLTALILVAVIWVWLLDRRMRAQSATVARQEQQRSHILELISSSEPLAQVLREIQSMVSSWLNGASCWFELNRNAGEVEDLELMTGPAIVSQELFSPERASQGFLLAIPPPEAAPNTEKISAALQAGGRLAELAIDTRRLYSDLHHRSEYDLLTDIPNRFSMEKRLDQLLLSARSNEAVFGLIYVDLDRFKQINDQYGHRVGDLYLQQIARRMKLQLRNCDVLARIGGDEFIALVPILRSRTDAEEIAIRLERCFDEPFDLEGYCLHGSVSVGLAVYPQDGATREALERSADVAMYAHKETKRKARLNENELAEELHRMES